MIEFQHLVKEEIDITDYVVANMGGYKHNFHWQHISLPVHMYHGAVAATRSMFVTVDAVPLEILHDVEALVNHLCMPVYEYLNSLNVKYIGLYKVYVQHNNDNIETIRVKFSSLNEL